MALSKEEKKLLMKQYKETNQAKFILKQEKLRTYAFLSKNSWEERPASIL